MKNGTPLIFRGEKGTMTLYQYHRSDLVDLQGLEPGTDRL